MNRRTFLKSGLAGLAATAARGTKKKYRAAVIGHTGHGDYGHGLDIVWSAFESVEVVAVADPDEPGRGEALERTGARRAYRDYREMLRNEKPDLVSVCPRFLDQRVEMVTAAAEAGAHLYLEKPFAPSLLEADQMLAAIERNAVKVQMAHQTRLSPYALKVRQLLEDGAIGQIQEVRGRGKEDRRAGGEDLMVLGSHICDLMRMYLGDPRWVFAHVSDDGEDISRRHLRTPTEPVGPIAGNQMAAMFAFDHGVHGYFGSKASDQTHGDRFSIQIFGSKGVIFFPVATYPKGQPYLLRSPAWLPNAGQQWEPIEATPDTAIEAKDRQLSNALMVADLLQAIEQNREPVCSARDGRWTIEMIVGIYESQVSGGRVRFPLENRRHPLARL